MKPSVYRQWVKAPKNKLVLLFLWFFDRKSYDECHRIKKEIRKIEAIYNMSCHCATEEDWDILND